MARRRRISLWRPRTTLRARITTVATLVVFVVLVATASALVFTQSLLLRENLDESLVGAADSLEALVVSGTMPALLPRLGDEDSIGLHQHVVAA